MYEYLIKNDVFKKNQMKIREVERKKQEAKEKLERKQDIAIAIMGLVCFFEMMLLYCLVG